MLIISVRSLASRTLTMAGGSSVVCSLEVVPDFPGPPCMNNETHSSQERIANENKRSKVVAYEHQELCRQVTFAE